MPNKAFLNFIRQNRYLLFPYLAFLTIGALVLLSYNKATIHLFLNQFYSGPTDFFFTYLTLLGDGWSSILIVLVLLWFSYRKAIILGLSYALSAITTQLLKNFVFPTHSRPIGIFNAAQQLHLVKGVTMYSSFSFPSGHSTSAMALFLCLGLFTPKNWLKTILCLSGLLVCYSRVYLSEHFFEDIYAGSIIGTIWALLIYYQLQNGKDSNLRQSLSQKV